MLQEQGARVMGSTSLTAILSSPSLPCLMSLLSLSLFLGGISPDLVSGSPVKQQQNYLTWAEGEAEAEAEAAGGCEWVGHLTSQLRLPLLPEEVAVGCLADVARATLWKAVKSLMEDLLRAAHFQAWRETTTVPPPTITLPHVLAALTTARPEFDIFSDHGLGTPSEVI